MLHHVMCDTDAIFSLMIRDERLDEWQNKPSFPPWASGGLPMQEKVQESATLQKSVKKLKKVRKTCEKRILRANSIPPCRRVSLALDDGG